MRRPLDAVEGLDAARGTSVLGALLHGMRGATRHTSRRRSSNIREEEGRPCEHPAGSGSRAERMVT